MEAQKKSNMEQRQPVSAAHAKSSSRADADQLQQLEHQINELLALTEVLAKENRALRIAQHNWSSERAKLIEKNEVAKTRVESMITRLKALERE